MIREPLDADAIACRLRDQARVLTDFDCVAEAFTALDQAMVERHRARGEYREIGLLYCKVGDRVEAALREALAKKVRPECRRVLVAAEGGVL